VWDIGDDPICCTEIYSRVVVVFCDGKCEPYCSEIEHCTNANCADTVRILCANCILTYILSPNVSGYDAVWCDANDEEVGSGNTYEPTESGLFTVKVDKDGCDQLTDTYEFTKPNAGDTTRDINDPIIIN